MPTFDDWLDAQPESDPQAAPLKQARQAAGGTWPSGAAGWSPYAAVIANDGGGDKRSLLAALEQAYARFEPTPARGFWSTIASWISNVYLWSVLLGTAFIFGLFRFALDQEMLTRLADIPTARGLVTFLFAIATVGIALVIVLAVFLSSAKADEIAARYQMGKDVLAVLIGVLGTIIGFYFGSQLDQSPASRPGNEQAAPASGAAAPSNMQAAPPTPNPG